MSDDLNQNPDSGTEENRERENSAPAGNRDLSGETNAEHENIRQDGITYSWVNPKLEHREETREDRNWSGRTFTEDENPSGSYRYGGPQNSSGSHRYGGPQNSTGSCRYGGPQNGTGNDRTGGSAGAAFSAKKKKKTAGSGMSAVRKWLTLVVMAVVFGLIAGLVSFGVQQKAESESGSGNAGQTESPDSGQADNSIDVVGSSGTESSGESDETESDPGSTQNTVADVAAKTLPSIVTISTVSVEEMQSFFGGTQQYEVEGSGSGVIVGKNDSEILIATTNHVVEGAQVLSVGFNDQTANQASIKGTDAENDLAVIAVSLSDLSDETKNSISVIELGNSDDLVLGEQVVALGNALGQGGPLSRAAISAV
ncbi:MAG: trypsin-like peptidase domain-containing protein [Bilifractor sp.]|jgi:serine protease Do